MVQEEETIQTFSDDFGFCPLNCFIHLFPFFAHVNNKVVGMIFEIALRCSPSLHSEMDQSL